MMALTADGQNFYHFTSNSDGYTESQNFTIFTLYGFLFFCGFTANGLPHGDPHMVNFNLRHVKFKECDCMSKRVIVVGYYFCVTLVTFLREEPYNLHKSRCVSFLNKCE